MPRHRRLPKFISHDESERLLTAAESPRDRLLILLGLHLGLRVSELRRLRQEDIAFDQGLVMVRHGKGDNDRNLPLPLKLREPLLAWTQDHPAWLFPSNKRPDRPIGSRYVQLMIQAAARRAGIVRKVTPHVLRHTFATRLLHLGADLREVQELMGHSSLAITEIYLHCLPERLRSAVDRL